MKNQKITSNEVSNSTYFNEINQEYVSTINTIFNTQNLTDNEKLLLCKDIINDYQNFKVKNKIEKTKEVKTKETKKASSGAFFIMLFVIGFILLFAHSAKAQTNGFKMFVDSIKIANNEALNYDYASNVITEKKAFGTSYNTLWYYYNARLPKLNATAQNKENKIIIREVPKITIQKDTTNEIVNNLKIDSIKIEVPTIEYEITAPQYKTEFVKIEGILKMNKKYKDGFVKWDDGFIEEVTKKEFDKLDDAGSLEWIANRTFIMSKMKEVKTLITTAQNQK